MEALLQYCWKHRILPLGELRTTDGRLVEVINPGLHNHDAGPDFLNAVIKIDGVSLSGSVEVHIKSKDWYTHGHHNDRAYNNVILHVVETVNSEGAVTEDGVTLPEIIVPVPERVKQNWEELLNVDSYPPCYKVIPELKPLTVHSWMAALQTERLMQKTEAIDERLRMLNGDWEHAFFTTLARSLGFGSNSDALELWARNLPLNAIAHHRDDLFQVEAMFFGMAGMLNVAAVRERMKLETAADEYFQRLSNEYEYLKHKFSLEEGAMRSYPWQFMRMRPQNFPHIRIAQLARLYHERRISLSQLLEVTSVDDMRKMLRCGVSKYWEKHYTFGHESTPNSKQLSTSSINVLMINCTIPMIFAYGKQMGREDLCERAFDMLEQLKAEDNNITRMWKQVGLNVENAGDSQALIQLKKQYCDRKDCLRCRIGFEYLRIKR